MAAVEDQVAQAEGDIEAQAEEQEAVEDFEPLDRMQTLGIPAGDIKKAKDAGFFTVSSFIMNPKKVLANIKGLSEAKVEKMVEAAKKLSPQGGWRTGSTVHAERLREVVKITTGCKQLDELLGGGMETKAITEIYGEFRCGKTQICHTLAVTCQMPENMGGGAGKVAYVDSEHTFRGERIRAIAERFGLDPDAVLDNIVYARAFNHEHQMDLLLSLAALMVDDPFKLLIVDSLTANFRTDFIGRGELAERQQKLGQMLARLKKISEEFNVAVVVTNQVVSDPGGGMTFVADPKKAVGGHVVAHASTTRLSLRKGKGEQRLCKVVQSPWLAEGETSFALGAGGVEDYKD